jgi:putative hydrolase of the HAD superfamily
MDVSASELVHKIYPQYAVDLKPVPTDVKPRTHSLPGIQAVLFDVYGTLLISGSGEVGTVGKESSAGLFYQALHDTGAGPIDTRAGESGSSLYYANIAESHKRSISVGIDFPEVNILSVWTAVLNELKNKELISSRVGIDLINRVAITYEALSNPTGPMPMAAETLENLHERKIILGIVSNAQFYTIHFLSAGLGRKISELYFDESICVFSYSDMIAKPSSQIFQSALARLDWKYGISADQTLYVGNDMLNDVFAASSTGCRTCLFAGDTRSLRLRENDQRCKDQRPDAVITGLDQIPAIISTEIS